VEFNATFALIDRELEAAEEIAAGRRRWPPRSLLSALSGSDVIRASAHLDAVETVLLRIAPAPYVRGQLPTLQAHVRGNLPLGDPRRASVERISRDSELSASELDALVAAVRAASSAARREIARLGSLRNVVLVATLTLFTAAVALAVLGAVDPDLVPMCFTFPQSATCPTQTVTGGADPLAQATSGWDIAIVELIGLIGGALAAAFSLRSLAGLATPVSLPAGIALLKLPTGALTAVCGILLMRGGFIPGFSSLQEPAEIIGWAAVFGFGQQLLTRQVDAQARAVLEHHAGDASHQESASSADIDRSVATSLEATLAGPSLINFHGTASVSVEGAYRAAEPEARFLVPPGPTPPTVVVTIGPDPEPGALSAPLVVEEGDVAPVVPFIVTVDAEGLARERLEQHIEVTDGGEARALTFPVELQPGTAPRSVWVRVTQHGRLLQIIGLELEATT
jgi:hypothetical protein